MRTLAVLPIKGFEVAKARLAAEASLAAGTRRALAEAMFTDVLTALRRSREVDATLVVTSSSGAFEIARGHGALVLDDPGDAGQSAAASIGIARALELDMPRVLLVPGDVPAIDPAELDEMLRGDRAEVTIIPDRHGTGTNGLLLAPPDAIEPAFGPDSRALHEDAAEAAGRSWEILEPGSLILDIDTPEDLGALRERLAATRGGAAHTRGMLMQLDRSVGATVPS